MREKSDLLIHYDEDAQKFVFFMVDVKDTAVIRAATFDGVAPTISFFKEKTPEEAERVLGSMVFAGIDHTSIKRVGIRDYQMESENARQQDFKEMENAAENGDCEAQYFLSLEFHVRASKSGQLADLRRADELLISSFNGGYLPAIQAMENWPLVKAAAEERIRRSGNLASSSD